ncbi:LuxR C-terminal-related transcriptional regulator [Calidithermus chliarophilus]|uniref:LuxR C-terminal-related transcriptional regulator n=1 Tax=Calidithermus chliarophilus TaxID=52023 RepID=UPI00041C36EE|nr:LuxR C-terminal-related transcriptional regulator [Calidithermus chliarophilus]
MSKSVTIHGSSPWLCSAAEALYGTVRLSKPVTLVLDQPVGFALQVLPLLQPPCVVATQSASPHYLHDLAGHHPAAVLLEPVSPQRMLEVLELVASGAVLPTPGLEAAEPLTQRERQVARLLVKGLSDKEIARELRVEPKTVSNWVYSLKQKIGADNRSQVGLLYLGLRVELP